MSDDIDYGKWWEELRDSGELYDFIPNKFKEYVDMGYEVSHFRSLSLISIFDNTITFRGPYHELKTIHAMDKYLKEKEDE